MTQENPLFGETRSAKKMRKLGPESLNDEQQQWELMRKSLDRVRNHPLMPELQRVGIQAQAKFRLIAMHMNMPNSEARVMQGWEDIGNLYNQACELRAKMLTDGIRAAMNIAPGAPLKDCIVQQLHDAFLTDNVGGTHDPDGSMENNKEMKGIVKSLEPYAKGLGVDPSDVQLNRHIKDNIFYVRHPSGRLEVNIQAVASAYKELDMVSGSVVSRLNPRQLQVLQGMRLALAQVEMIDPVRAELAARYGLNASDPSANKPLRLVGALGGSLIAGLGLVMAFKKGGTLTWPTFLWAGVAAFCINPDLLKDRAFHTMKHLEFMKDPKMQAVLHQLPPKEGAAALMEIQALNGKGKTKLQQLLREKTFSLLQLEQLTGDTTSALYQVMKRVPDTDRVLVLRTLAAPQNKDEAQIVGKYLLARGGIPDFVVNTRVALPASPMAIYRRPASAQRQGQPTHWYVTSAGFVPMANVPSADGPPWQQITVPDAPPNPNAPLTLGLPGVLPSPSFMHPQLALNSVLGDSAPYVPHPHLAGRRIIYRGPIRYRWYGRPLTMQPQPMKNFPPNRANNPMLQNRTPFPNIYPPWPGTPRPWLGPFPPTPGWPPHS